MQHDRTITMRNLGKQGRFGNQLFQYAFLRAYAAEYNCELQLPRWVGCDLFGHDDPDVTANLPVYHERTSGSTHLDAPLPPAGDELVNHDFVGYAQYHTSWWDSSRRHWWRSLFSPTASVRARMADAESRFDGMGKTKIGFQIRRGDYGQLIFYLTPVEWYLRWLNQWWGEFDDPVLFIATEDKALIEPFAAYRPVTTETLGIDLRKEPMSHCTYLSKDLHDRDPHLMDFYPDWHLLTRCDVLVTPNSTFSFTAGMVSKCLKMFFRSSLPKAGIVEENLWDTWPLQHDRVEDYSHLEGIALKDNPYWK